MIHNTRAVQRKLVAALAFQVAFAVAWTVPSSPSTLNAHSPPNNIMSRRQTVLATPLLVMLGVTPISSRALSSQQPPLSKGITTVILNSASDSKLGVKLEDVVLGPEQKLYPVVQAAAPDGPAGTQGIVPGMIVLGQPSSKRLVERLQSGPYPFAIQFYDLSVEYGEGEEEKRMDAATALERAKTEALQRRTAPKEPPLSAKGTGLVVKTTRKVSECPVRARSGDRVTILYEARVASPGGPIYDSTAERSYDGKPITFRLGEGKAIPGVEIGMGGMCQGEVRELDIPSGLGYGRFGSEVFDVPGDVRLWWRVELLELVPGENKFPFR